jgi:hypothetical protein
MWICTYRISAEGATHIAEAIKVSTCVVVAQLSNNSCYSATKQ